MIKILLLIHDLGQGGAERVLVNLVNSMDKSKFDITVMTLFDCGVNRQFLASEIRYQSWCPKMIPGNSHLMKILTPEQLHRLIIKEHYDIEVAYLEGPCARVISGCQDPETRTVCWIHCTMTSAKVFSASFKNMNEAKECYKRFDVISFVSQGVRSAFLQFLPDAPRTEVIYNTNNTGKILAQKDKTVDSGIFAKSEIRICGVGKLVPHKGFDKLLRIHKRLRDEGYPVHTYILGDGPERSHLENYIKGQYFIENVH